MRTILLMLASAVAFLASCTKTEVLEIARNRAISFEPFVENPTKAVNDIDNNNFNEFYVFGAKGTKTANAFTADDDKYLNHVKVHGGAGNWTYDNPVPWISGKTFRFAAYADGRGVDAQQPVMTNETATSSISVAFVPDDDSDDTWGLDITDYTVSDRDLIVAVPAEVNIGTITAVPEPVNMKFEHALAKVVFEFKYPEGRTNDNLSLEIEPITFNASKTGDLEVRFNNNATISREWTIDNDNKALYTFFEKDNDDNQSWDSDTITSEMYVIPQSNQDLTVDITFHTKKSGEITMTQTYKDVSLAVPGNNFWQPGFVYRYIAEITPEYYINFSASVTGWTDHDFDKSDEDADGKTITLGTVTGSDLE